MRVTWPVLLTGLLLLAPAPPAPQEAPPAQDPPPAGANGVATIKAGDSLDVSVFKHPELFKTVSVQPDGTASYPFLGTVRVAGRTVTDFARDIEKALTEGYALRNPRVSVSVVSFAARTAYILGRVKAPGAYEIPVHRPLTLLQLIARAGGFQEDADAARVRILRTRGEEDAVLRIDLGSMDDPLLEERNLNLRDGDTVIVPRSADVTVLGQVNRPRSFPIRPGETLTLLRAVGTCSGFSRLADRSEILWIRGEGRGRTVTKIDAGDILEDKEADPVLAPGDIVYVTERFL